MAGSNILTLGSGNRWNGFGTPGRPITPCGKNGFMPGGSRDGDGGRSEAAGEEGRKAAAAAAAAAAAPRGPPRPKLAKLSGLEAAGLGTPAATGDETMGEAGVSDIGEGLGEWLGGGAGERIWGEGEFWGRGGVAAEPPPLLLFSFSACLSEKPY